MEKAESRFMERCIQIAAHGMGQVAPNPLVGCVIVHEEKIVAEGYHAQYGGAHAEVNALRVVSKEIDLSECTLYVNLEPCSHYGKTPPCADLLIHSGIKNVVIGTLDPNPLVAGKGIKKLQDAGIAVKHGIEKAKCEWLNRRFFVWHLEKRPYVILKWAQTGNGFMDILRKNGEKGTNWISAQSTKRMVHRWRAEESSILIGANTMETDNPELTVREVAGNNPLRVVLVGGHAIPEDALVLNDKAKTLFIHQGEVKGAISDAHEHIVMKPEISLDEVLRLLYERAIQSVLVEGGRQVLESFIKGNNWDEARVITGKVDFEEGLPAPDIAGELVESFFMDSDHIKILRHT